MELPTYFTRFLKEIRPTEKQREKCKTGHQTLRDRLDEDTNLKPILVSTFLQGSYRRATAVRPKGEAKLPTFCPLTQVCHTVGKVPW